MGIEVPHCYRKNNQTYEHSRGGSLLDDKSKASELSLDSPQVCVITLIGLLFSSRCNSLAQRTERRVRAPLGAGKKDLKKIITVSYATH